MPTMCAAQGGRSSPRAGTSTCSSSFPPGQCKESPCLGRSSLLITSPGRDCSALAAWVRPRHRAGAGELVEKIFGCSKGLGFLSFWLWLWVTIAGTTSELQWR